MEPSTMPLHTFPVCQPHLRVSELSEREVVSWNIKYDSLNIVWTQGVCCQHPHWTLSKQICFPSWQLKCIYLNNFTYCWFSTCSGEAEKL